MRRRDFLYVAGSLASLALHSRVFRVVSFSAADGKSSTEKLIGMYCFEGSPYKHPYSARTWTLEDWHGYADGLKKLGYNMLLIWPLVEFMPASLSPDDHASLENKAKLIKLAHDEFGMHVYVTLVPNSAVNNKVAANYTFKRRPFSASTTFVCPSDPLAVEQMMRRREELLRPLAEMDGLVIIDSDPGGYPGSTNAQFVSLLSGHRKTLDRIRPGIEMYYWMHVGWEAYSRYYQTGRFEWGTPAEAEDVLTRLKKVDPKPWGITVHTVDVPPNGTDLNLAKTVGLASTALAFNYGAIEGEPSFPMTNFGGNSAFEAGHASAPRGVVGNAQSHCLQLPNTFAFARGALGNSLPMEADYVQFADGLIPGQGRLIAQGWEALSGKDTAAMRALADKMEALPKEKLTPGPLKGLLFGDPQRFVTDLVMELRLKAAYSDFVVGSVSELDADRFGKFLAAAEAWEARHGYQGVWNWPDLGDVLKKLQSPTLEKLFGELDNETITTQGAGKTPFDRVQDLYRKWDHFTPLFLQAMKEALRDITTKAK